MAVQHRIAAEGFLLASFGVEIAQSGGLYQFAKRDFSGSMGVDGLFAKKAGHFGRRP